MSEKYIIVPGTGRKIYDGTVVILNRLPNLKWVIHYGFYSYNGKSTKGWYFSSIPSMSVMPVFNEDLANMRVVDGPVPPCPPPPCPPHPHPHPPVPTPTIFTPEDKLMVDRSMITVPTLEERDKLSSDDLQDGKICRVNDIDSQGTIEYYSWNSSKSQWEEASLGYRYLTRDEIEEKIATGIISIVYSDSKGALVITANSGKETEVPLVGLVHNAVYTKDTMTLRLPVFGSEDIVLTIPRDKYLTGIRFEENYQRPDGTWGPSIVCTISDGVTETEIVTDASKIRNVYTGGETNEAKVIVEEGTNIITCEVKLSTIPNNALKLDNTGFYVDLSGKVDKKDFAAGCLLVADGQGGFTNVGDGVMLATTGTIADLDNPSKYAVTANLIIQAIDAAIAALQQSIEDRLSKAERAITNLDARVTAIEEHPGTVIIDSHGAPVTVLTKGDATLGTGDVNTVATEAAVVNALSFKEFES